MRYTTLALAALIVFGASGCARDSSIDQPAAYRYEPRPPGTGEPVSAGGAPVGTSEAALRGQDVPPADSSAPAPAAPGDARSGDMDQAQPAAESIRAQGVHQRSPGPVAPPPAPDATQTPNAPGPTQTRDAPSQRAPGEFEENVGRSMGAGGTDVDIDDDDDLDDADDDADDEDDDLDDEDDDADDVDGARSTGQPQRMGPGIDQGANPNAGDDGVTAQPAGDSSGVTADPPDGNTQDSAGDSDRNNANDGNDSDD